MRDLSHEAGAAPKAPDSRRPRRVPEPNEEAQGGQVEQALDAPADLAAASVPVDVEEEALTNEEIATYRRRIAEGVYDSREVADEVARRMMEKGDV